MIGYLQGTVVSTDGVKCILLTNSGVGYEVSYNQFLNPNSKKELFISTVIKENSHSLFGFNSFQDKVFFLEFSFLQPEPRLFWVFDRFRLLARLQKEE